MSDAPSAPDPDEQKALDELRSLLVGEQDEKIVRLERRIEDPAANLKTVSEVLPEAVRLRNESDDKLTRAMAPSVDEVIRESVRRRPKVLADALFPIMGPAIRKSIVDTLQRFVQSLNQALEHSLSPQSFKWRLEAWRTGRPFAEIVLSRTLLYRVEQVFLIHGETGLLLHHIAIPEIDTEDSDMVSGMLTAIQDFVRDSFGGDDGEGPGLRSAKVGELTLWAESGPAALIALVIRGTPRESLREGMHEVLEELHLTHGEAMADFEGDAAPFADTEPSLETLLIQQGQQVQEQKAEKKKSRLIPALGLALGLLLAAWIFFAVRDRLRWRDFLADLDSAPGIVLTESDRGERRLRGLRDPLAADPEALFRRHFDEDEDYDGRFGRFDSTDTEIVIKRARKLLELPDEVEASLTFEGGILSASGAAKTADLIAASQRAKDIPGVIDVDFRAVRRPDADVQAARAELFERLRAEEGVVLLDSPNLVTTDAVEVLVDPALLESLRERLGGSSEEGLLKRADLTLRWRAFRSESAVAWRARVTRAMGWPEGLEVQDDAGRLVFRGAAAARWVARLRGDASLAAADRPLDFSQASIVVDPLGAAWAAFVQTLRGTPGIVVSEASVVHDDRDPRVVRGFRDPLAEDPQALARAEGFEADFESAFAPHVSTEPRIVGRRFQTSFSPPATLEFEVDAAGTLVLRGEVTRSWWDSVREAAAAIPGLRRVDITALQIVEPVRPLEESWKILRTALDAEPGFRVETFERAGENLRLEGRRDALARPLSALLADAGVGSREVLPLLRDYVSSHPVIALRRARRLLNPPESVVLEMRGTTLVARGDAPIAWRRRVEKEAGSIAGIDGADVRGLRDLDRRQLERRLEGLAARVVVFGDGKTAVAASQDAELDAVAEELQQIIALADPLGVKVKLEVLGFPDRFDAARAPSYADDPDYYRDRSRVALDRAAAVKRRLVEGTRVLRDRLSAVGANERSWRSIEEGALARRLGPSVVFRGSIVPKK